MRAGRRHIVLNGVCNLRDLGGYTVAGGGSTRWGQILRSDSLHGLQDSGIDALIEAGLTRVIDLRDAGEIVHQPSPFFSHQSVSYIQVPLFAHLDLHAHLARLVGVDDILLELYCEVLTQRQAVLSQALSAVAEASPGTVLFHCTVGKDRTGILAALLLAAVGASAEDIVADYALTSGRIDVIRQGMMKKINGGDIDQKSLSALFSSEPSTMRSMLNFLHSRYGGIDPYFKILDPDRILREKLRQRMLC